MVRDSMSEFDKGDLKDELKHAGFEDCMANNIADRVDDRKAHGWTYSTGRQEAIREAQMLIDSSRAALDNFRTENRTNRTESNRDREYRESPSREPTSKEVLTRETY